MLKRNNFENPSAPVNNRTNKLLGKSTIDTNEGSSFKDESFY